MKRYPSCILATCVLPWDERFRLMEDCFREQVRAILSGLTRHVYLFGTAGEGYAVNDAQFERIVHVFRESTGEPDACPMVGLISLSLSTVIHRIDLARDLGFRTFQVSLPSWGTLSDPEVDGFFRETCGRFPDCRFLHYNLPRAGRLLDGAFYRRLAAAHPNLVAVKSVARDRETLVDLVTGAPDLQFFFTDIHYTLVRDDHECGYLVSLGMTSFDRTREVFSARGDRLKALGRSLGEVRDALFQAVGGGGFIDGAYDKALYKVGAPDFPLRLLPPYRGLDDETFRRFRRALPKGWLSTEDTP